MHVTIHRARITPAVGPAVSVVGHEVPTLLLSPADLAPLAVTFESAAAVLESIPRLYFEPDGSFVWVGEHHDWQLDGQLYDRGETLDYVELKGTCAAAPLALLLNALRSRSEPLVFQLVTTGAFVDETTIVGLLGR